VADPVQILQRAIDRLSEAVDRSDTAFDAEVENLANVVVDLIAASENEALREALPRIERLYSTTLIADAGGTDRDDAVVGQLGALVTLFSAAAARPGRTFSQSLLAKGIHGKLLIALKAAGRRLDNQEVVTIASTTKLAVAHALSKLRDAGLVLVTQEWRRKLIGLTELGHAAATELEATKPRETDAT